MTLQPDRDDLARFAHAILRYAQPGTWISLRSFDQHNQKAPAFSIRAVQINGSLQPVIIAATEEANKAANSLQPVVFAPPCATFKTSGKAGAGDLANGLVLSVELDDGNSAAALRRLEAILGFATCVVQSGSDWTDPDTGEITPKIHMHWRLSEPTTDPEEHAKLREARNLAALLVGADPTGKPVVHPLRWPGSWNRKKTPRIARLSQLHEAAEIHLDEALERLREAVEAAGIAQAPTAAIVSGKPEADPDLVISAVGAANNPDIHYDDWITRGYAIRNAMGGDERAFATFDEWSAKSSKYNAENTVAAWHRITRAVMASPVPVTVGAGTLFFHARREGWEFPAQEPPPWVLEGPEWVSVDTEAAHATEPSREKQAVSVPFEATGITAAEWNDIPPRERVYGHFLFRKFISCLGAPGGAGKTAYACGIAFAVAIGRHLLEEHVYDPGNVWFYNLEDPRSELLRRVKATALRHGVKYEDIKDRLFLDSGRDRPLVIARSMRSGDIIAWPQVPDLIAEIKARGVRLLIVDPFVRSHRVEENANDQVDFVAALWAHIADQADCAILLLHHFRKGGLPGDAASFRGASALIDASRAAVTLTTMAMEEAQSFAVPERDRWQFVRVDNAKLNLAPPPDEAIWLRLEGVDLHNGTDEMESDNVQSVSRWRAPSAFEGVSHNAVVAVLERLRAGPGAGEQYCLTGSTTGRWAGLVIMDETGKEEAEAKNILAVWKRSRIIKQTTYESPKDRRERSGMEVNEAMLLQMRASASSIFPG